MTGDANIGGGDEFLIGVLGEAAALAIEQAVRDEQQRLLTKLLDLADSPTLDPLNAAALRHAARKLAAELDREDNP